MVVIMRIPTYTQQVKPSGKAGASFSLAGEKRRPITGPFVPDTTMGSVGDALKDISNKMYQLEMTEQYNDAQINYRKGLAEIDNEMSNNQEWNSLTVDEYNKKFGELHSDLKQSILENTKNHQARKSAELFMTEEGLKAEVAVNGRARKINIDRNIAKNENTIEAGIKRFQTNGDFTIVKNLESIVKGQIGVLYSETEAEDLIDSIYSRAGIAYGRKLIADQPEVMHGIFSDEKKQPEFFKRLGETDEGAAAQQRLINEALTAKEKFKRKQEAADRVAEFKLANTLEDCYTNITNTGGSSINGERLIKQTIRDPERQALALEQHRANVDKAQKMNRARNIAVSGTAIELKNYIESVDPKKGGGGKGATLNSELHRFAISIKKERDEALKKDPVGWIKQYNPNADMDTLISEQIRLGASPQEISVVDKETAKVFSDRIINMDSEDIGPFIAHMEREYGADKFGIMWKDFTTKGDLPTGLMLAAAVSDPIAQRDIADAHKMKTADIEKSLGADKSSILKEISEEIDGSEGGMMTNSSGLADWERTVFASGVNTKNMETVNKMKGAIKNLAVYYVHKGMEPGPAAQKASEVINGRYNFSNTFRVPKEYDIKTIEDVTDNYIDVLKPRHLHKDFQDDAIIDSLHRTGKWVTNENETGVVLLHETGIPVRLVDGSRAEIFFEEYK